MPLDALTGINLDPIIQQTSPWADITAETKNRVNASFNARAPVSQTVGSPTPQPAQPGATAAGPTPAAPSAPAVPHNAVPSLVHKSPPGMTIATDARGNPKHETPNQKNPAAGLIKEGKPIGDDRFFLSREETGLEPLGTGSPLAPVAQAPISPIPLAQTISTEPVPIDQSRARARSWLSELETPQALAPVPPRISPFHGFLMTLRDIATGRASDPNSLAGQIRGGFGHAADTLQRAAIAVGGPEAILKQRQLAIEAPKVAAETEAQRAEAELRREQAKMMGQMVTLPNGMTMPLSALQNYLRGGYAGEKGAESRLAAEQMRSAASRYATDVGYEKGIDVANIQAQRQRNSDLLRIALAQNKATAHPYREADGRLTMHAYNQFQQDLGEIPNELLPPSYYGTATTTDRVVPTEGGGFAKVPVTTQKTPQIPGAEVAPARGGAPAPATGPGAGARIEGTATPILGPEGQPLRRKTPPTVMATDDNGRVVSGSPEDLVDAGIPASRFQPMASADVHMTTISRQMIGKGGLFNLIRDDIKTMKPEDFGPLNSRWNEFLAGTVGAGDPKYTRLRTHVNKLLATAAMQAHVGGRASKEFLAHFKNIADAGKMNWSTLNSALGAEYDYFREKAGYPMIQARDPKGIVHEAPNWMPVPKGWTRIRGTQAQ